MKTTYTKEEWEAKYGTAIKRAKLYKKETEEDRKKQEQLEKEREAFENEVYRIDADGR